mmetsp:Transcript_32447/g.28735  ORF Transcript_32447/g.28735 Transcript_32447/m.28735 type:complete len:80 (+) Transcript_32447:454-693(+)
MPKFYTRNGIIQHDVSNFKIEKSRDMKSSKSKSIQTPMIKTKFNDMQKQNINMVFKDTRTRKSVELNPIISRSPKHSSI